MLTPQEADELFAILRSLRRTGVDRLHQPQARRGDRDRGPDHGHPPRPDVETVPREDATEATLAERWSAARSCSRVDKPPATAGRRRCSRSRTCTCIDDRGIEQVRGVSLQVRAGEILGIAGVDGNGQAELSRRSSACGGPRRADRARRARPAPRDGARDARRRRRLRPRRPPAARARARVLDRREPRPARLREPPDARWGWLFPARLVDARGAADHASSTCAAAAR